MRLAYLDESVRREYLICAAVIDACDSAAVRRLVRELCLPGQRRWHFAKESDPRRRLILSALAGSGLVRFVGCRAPGDGPLARAACLAELVPLLADHGVSALVIESRSGQDGADRRTVRETPMVDMRRIRP